MFALTIREFIAEKCVVILFFMSIDVLSDRQSSVIESQNIYDLNQHK